MSKFQPAAIDQAKLQAFMGKMVGDMSTAISGALVLIGDKLGAVTAAVYRIDARTASTSSRPDEVRRRRNSGERSNGIT
jgi:hypothetical protein